MTTNNLPDLVVHKFIRLVPTKDAARMMFVSKQWEGVWFLDPVLDFDEGVGRYNDDDQHEKFIKFVNNTLKRYLEFFDIHQHKLSAAGTNKFRICMMRYLSGDALSVDKWLNLLFERSVKELDISLCNNIQGGGGVGKSSYSLSRMILVNAKRLTSLNLEFVTLKTMNSSINNLREKKDTVDISKCLLPSLKSMSLKTVHELDVGAIYSLTLECPRIQNLSLNACCFQHSHSEHRLSSSTLKSLEIEDCNYTELCVEVAVNLEAFRLVSSVLEHLNMYGCVNLKQVSVRVPSLFYFGIRGCHDSVAGTIDVPGLAIMLFEGHLASKLSIRTTKESYSSRIFLLDNWDDESDSAFKRPWKHFQSMRDFLAELGGNVSRGPYLFVNNFKDIMFPESFRETSSAPFRRASELYMGMKNTPSEERDISDLDASLRWMAPNAKFIHTAQHNHPSTVEEIGLDLWM